MIMANREKSKSSHKEIQKLAKIAFFISDECKNRVSGINYPDLEPGNEF